MVRTALYEAANVLLSRVTRFSALKRWGLEVAKRRGLKRAKVAVARRLAVTLHRMWIDGTTFRFTRSDAAEARACGMRRGTPAGKCGALRAGRVPRAQMLCSPHKEIASR